MRGHVGRDAADQEALDGPHSAGANEDAVSFPSFLASLISNWRAPSCFITLETFNPERFNWGQLNVFSVPFHQRSTQPGRRSRNHRRLQRKSTPGKAVDYPYLAPLRPMARGHSFHRRLGSP